MQLKSLVEITNLAVTGGLSETLKIKRSGTAGEIAISAQFKLDIAKE